MKIMSFMRDKRYFPSLPKSAHLSNERGITLIELLISLAITAVMAASIYGVYFTFYKRVNIQDEIQETLQNARASLDFMEREFINAGLNTGQAEALTLADANAIEFIYTDPESDSALSTTAGQRIRVKYGLETLSGITYLYRAVTTCTDAFCTDALGSNEPVIGYVNELNISYFDNDGGTLTPSDAAGRLNVRFATIELKVRTKNTLPGMTGPKEITVKTHLRIRNFGLGSTATDSTAPSPPTVLKVRDPGGCDSLKVKWTASTDGDVAGYKIYYGTTSGVYTGVIDVPLSKLSASTYSCSKSGSTYECTITPDLPSLSYSPSDDTADAMYYLAVKSYDNSFNNSTASTEIYGNPATSNADFAVDTQDSTLNPVKPAAVVNFIGSDGPGDNQVALSWDAYDTSTYPEVSGMRLFRSSSEITTFPINPSDPAIDWIAGEPGSGRAKDILPTDTTFTDDSAGLLGCYVYYYALSPVNCDSTLISDSDAAEDGDNTKYTSSDYGLTFGDGASEPASDSPAGADTSPAENTAPSAPIFDIRAGWKRVALSLTQPNDTDLARSCIYVNPGATYPSLHTDTLSYPLVDGCLQIDTLLTPSAQLIPDSGGIFTTSEVSPGASTSFWHDSLSTESPASPELADNGTFSYRDVAVDLCDNASGITEAQAVTVLCGEDPKEVDFTVNTTNHPKPPAVTLPTISACDTTSSIGWTEVSSDTASPSSPTNPYDLAGYRIARSTTSDFSSGNSMLTSGAPFWGSTYGDSGLNDGEGYYYRLISTDCVYEATNPSDATVITDSVSNYLHSIDLPVVYPGKIMRDEKCEGAGSCTQDNHREVLTGVDVDNTLGSGTNTSAPQTSYEHNTVTIFFENTSGSTLTIEKLTAYWVSTEAYLTGVTIGGGRGGLGEITTVIPKASSGSVGGFSPQTTGLVNHDITDVEIPANARYVPVTFTFTDTDGDPFDMREDKLLVDMDYQNDSTSTTTCDSNLTISETLESITVPFGPSVSATQQDRPTSPTFGYSVPGALGLNTIPNGANGDILVAGNLTVNISALVLSNTTDGETTGKVALNTPSLFYIATAKSITDAPTSGYTEVVMTDTGGGIYTGAIPANDGLRLWYYILATDADGNYDRDPEIGAGAYVYDQDTYVFDVCDLTPNAPTNLRSASVLTDINLEWVAPSTYTDGSPIDTGLDPLNYVVYRDGVEIAVVADPTLVYTDAPLVAPAVSGVFNYNVSVRNSCAAPGPNEGAKSNTSASCIGASGLGIMSVDKTSILVGESFNVTVVDCLALSTMPPALLPYNTSIEELNVGSFSTFNISSTWPESQNPTGILETSATSGQFEVTVNTSDDIADVGPTPIVHTLATGSNDITISYTWAANSPITIDVNPDPCDSVPSAPTGFSGVMAGVGSNETATLSWDAVTTNDDASAITDLAGYYVWEKVCANNKPNCTGGDIVADWFLRAAIAPDPTPSTPALTADNGNYGNREYYFKVTTYDTCGTPNQSVDSSEFVDPS
jgi:Tfp pilus assembly protein PilE